VIPVVVSVTLAVLLWPLCQWFVRVLRVRALAALLSVSITIIVTALMLWAVGVQLSGTLERLPEVLKLIARDVATVGVERAQAMQRTRAAIAELDRSVARVTGTARAATPGAAPGAAPASLVGSVVDAAGSAALAVSKSALAVALQCGAIALLTFFLLCNGPKLAARLRQWCARQATGPGRCAPALQEAAHQVLLFARVTLLTNAAFGMGIALGFAALGVPDPWMWGLAAGTLHFVPYAGLVVMMALAVLEVYAAQSSLFAALLGAGFVALVGVLAGTAMTVWLQGRAAKVDSALLFGGTLFWAVLWGAWGLVLGPLMVIITRLIWRESQALAARDAQPTELASGAAPTGSPAEPGTVPCA
jgi:predicted PurR-regulated permease PerM